MTYLAILVALALSGTAAFFSVLGLTAIFPASVGAVMIMGIVLEAAKVITVVWLHLHWNRVGRFIKSYLILAILMLMIITSMGVYGFLAKSHIGNQLKIDSGIGQEIRLLNEQLKTIKEQKQAIESDLGRLDTSVGKITELSKNAKEARQGLRESAKSKKDRDILVKNKEETQTRLVELESSRIKLEAELEIQEAEVGPIKYLANLYYGNANKEQLESAVRWAIIALVLVFDPLAIILLLGVSTLYRKEPKDNNPGITQRVSLKNKKKKGVVEISHKDIFRM